MVKKWSAGTVCSFAFLLFWLITSVEWVIYWQPHYFEKEYTKYNVMQSVSTDLPELLYVTDEMMDYLKDKRKNLDIVAKIDGQNQEFFNEREKAHMKDVKTLFLAAIFIRRVCVIVLLVLGYCYRKQLYFLAKSYFWLFPLFTALGIICTISAVSNFTMTFILFHKIFFRNDLWILNPATDRLVNIVPEPFFQDTAMRIGLIFGIGAILMWILSGILVHRHHTKNRSDV